MQFTLHLLGPAWGNSATQERIDLTRFRCEYSGALGVKKLVDRFLNHLLLLGIDVNESPEDRALSLTAILADAINFGLAKMAEVCPGTSLVKPAWSLTQAGY